jgi:pimeloyl-ACP methyl ester carboxylesterase
MSTTRSRKTFEFGPGERLTGSISDPPHGRAAIGAVIVGMGIAEFRVARKLASLGIVTLQLRERDEDPDWKAAFNKRGMRNFREGIEFLREQRGVGRFICMGNCGGGSVAFRVGLDDPRVIGLILTNPHISPALTIGESYAKRVWSAASWKQLLAGKANLRYHLRNFRLLAMSLLRRVAPIPEQTLIDQSGHNQDATMPDRFDERAGNLVRRGVNVLMAFSENDVGLTYFRRLYGQSFERLESTPGLSIKLLPTTTHIPSHDSAAASVLVSIVDRWAHDSGFAAPPVRDDGPTSPPVLPREPMGGSSDRTTITIRRTAP